MDLNTILNDDKTLQKRMEHMKTKSKKSFFQIFKQIYELTGKTPTEILEIAKEDQNKIIKREDGTLHNIDIDDRRISQIQDIYYSYLNSKEIKESTKKQYITLYRSFFPKTIQLPEPIYFDMNKKRIRTKDIPTYEDVEKAVSLAQKTMEKLLFLTPSVCGLRLSDVIRLKIKDIVNGTKIYHNGTLEDLLKQDPSKIIVCLDMEPMKTENQGNLCITFLPPWWVGIFFQLIEERYKIVEEYIKKLEKPKNKTHEKILKEKIKKYEVNEDSYIFLGKEKSHLKEVSAMKKFQRMNKKIGGEKDRNGYYGKFRSHNLRKLFSTTCRRNIGRIDVENKNAAASFTLLDAVSVMTGHTPPNMSNSDVYDAVEEDSEDSYLRQLYTGLLPYLMPKDSEFNLKRDKKQLKKKQKEMEYHIINQNDMIETILARVERLEYQTVDENNVSEFKKKFCK